MFHALTPFLAAISFRSIARRAVIFLPGAALLFLPHQPTADAGHGIGSAATIATMVVAWIVSHLSSPGSGPFAADASSPGLPHPLLSLRALAAWDLGALAAATLAAVAWVPVVFLLRHDPRGSSAITLLLGTEAAIGCALVVWTTSAVLPRPAAVAASGAWLLLNCSSWPLASSVSGRVASLLAFPVSPAWIGVDEAAQLGSVLRALAGGLLFDVGLFALLLALQARRPR